MKYLVCKLEVLAWAWCKRKARGMSRIKRVHFPILRACPCSGRLSIWTLDDISCVLMKITAWRRSQENSGVHQNPFRRWLSWQGPKYCFWHTLLCYALCYIISLWLKGVYSVWIHKLNFPLNCLFTLRTACTNTWLSYNCTMSIM